MKRKILAIALAASFACGAFTGCGSSSAEDETGSATAEVEASSEEAAETEEDSADEEETSDESETAAVLEDGVYTADFDTDSSMFHVNEALDGKGTLTVENGEMTIHVTLAGTGIVNLYVGLAEDAESEDAVLLEPTLDEVTYSDGTTEEVYGFDIPVAVLDEEFDVALIGSKGIWYDHKVSVSNPEPVEE